MVQLMRKKMGFDYFDAYILLLLIVEISFVSSIINPPHPTRDLFLL